MKTDYQCVLIEDVWHATQERANPPKFQVGTLAGAWTICCKWGQFNRGFEKMRPTCPECLKHCNIDEEKYPNTKK